ncbi:hypothetical protein [Humibacter ginsenosidimutans]|uniref:Uncharacterized protein n=1 Tax=Humibacter ginsenosidimutans TaxID=2599293 RepID=A0A5B8MA39_9MICO|nr:hypothetical protein [Humibacter ginsenosidimutans]QDZ16330.1 hypothetical protein FPZ11_17625 [Humibacter ginsenosidimutans]
MSTASTALFTPSITITVGVVLLTVIGIAYGGTFMLRVVTGKQGANGLQKSFFRAGHAHAGVLVILGLVVLLAMSAAGAGVWGQVVGTAVLACALLIPGGFFFSVIGHDPQKPNAAKALIWIGFTVLTVAMLTGGILLIAVGVSAV